MIKQGLDYDNNVSQIVLLSMDIYLERSVVHSALCFSDDDKTNANVCHT